MSDDFGPGASAERPQVDEPNLWIGPLVAAAAVIIPILILVFSNTSTARVEWAGFDWEAPLWMVLAATFAAGAIGGKLAGWGWRQWRKRRRRLRSELEALRRRDPED